LTETITTERRRPLQDEADKAMQAADEAASDARRFLYSDIESLLNIGFLSHRVRVAGVNLSLRSLSPGDTFLLRHRVNSSYDDHTWKTWVVSSSIWMINGMNLLDDPRSVSDIHQIVNRLPKIPLDDLFYIVMGLFNRVSTAIQRTESYCYESYSRAVWRFAGQQSPSRDEYTGIPGTSKLGTNHVQRMWVAYNIAEDDRLDHIQQWQSAKFVASAMNPKGVKRVTRSDESLRKREEGRRRDAIALMIHQILHGKEEMQSGEIIVMVRGKPMIVPRVKTARTVDELDEQMRMWVAGEKDWHDLVVDTYKNRIRDQFADERQKREAIAPTQPGVTSGSTPLVGYTPEQIRELRPDLMKKKVGARQVFDGAAGSVLYEKFVARDAKQGNLRADEFGVVETPPGERSNLQGDVEKRRPAFRSEPIEPGGERGGY